MHRYCDEAFSAAALLKHSALGDRALLKPRASNGKPAEPATGSAPRKRRTVLRRTTSDPPTPSPRTPRTFTSSPRPSPMAKPTTVDAPAATAATRTSGESKAKDKDKGTADAEDAAAAASAASAAESDAKAGEEDSARADAMATIEAASSKNVAGGSKKPNLKLTVPEKLAKAAQADGWSRLVSGPRSARAVGMAVTFTSALGM